MSATTNEMLSSLNRALLKVDEIREEFPSTEWLGFAGATESSIKSAEVRIGKELPNSYRSFLSISDGWSTTGWNSISLLPCRKIGWLEQIDRDLVRIWGDTGFELVGKTSEEAQLQPQIDEASFGRTLVISTQDWANQDYFLLNPWIQNEAGEWQALHFSSEFPGVIRYPSFLKLLEEQIRQLSEE